MSTTANPHNHFLPKNPKSYKKWIALSTPYLWQRLNPLPSGLWVINFAQLPENWEQYSFSSTTGSCGCKLQDDGPYLAWIGCSSSTPTNTDPNMSQCQLVALCLSKRFLKGTIMHLHGKMMLLLTKMLLQNSGSTSGSVPIKTILKRFNYGKIYNHQQFNRGIWWQIQQYCKDS